LAGGIDEQQGARCAIHGNALDACEIDRLAELEDCCDCGLPPKFRILIDEIAVLSRWGQGRRRYSVDIALRIDSTCANPACADVYAEEQTCHSNLPPLGACLAGRRLLCGLRPCRSRLWFVGRNA
jgi:hypothetical protein